MRPLLADLPRRTKDLDEVLQSRLIFLNVSKGQTAKESDLMASFGTVDVDRVILEILQKGEVQVGSEERGQQIQMMVREVATIVADKCVNPRTKTPYPVSMIEQALAELHFSPNLNKSAKQQALETIKLLEKQEKFPISRAQMRLSIQASMADSSKVLEAVKPLLAAIESEEHEGQLLLTCLIEPGQFRAVTESVAKATKGKGAVNMISLRDLKESSEASLGP